VRPQFRALVAAIGLVLCGLLVAPAAQAAQAPSPATQARITDALYHSARFAGTAWESDPATGRVVVLADQSVTGAVLGRIKAVLAPYGDAARVERVSGTFGVRLSGGDPIFGSGFRCTLGANVTSGGTNYFLTAGHCGNVVSTWYSDSGQTTIAGTTTGASFPFNDYAIVRYATGVTPTHDFTAAGSPSVGQSVCMRGSTSGLHCGVVTGLNATVNYGDGTVSGLIQTNICSEPGDSGAPLFSGKTVYGILSGGSGNCSSGGVSFFQPITEILSAYGVTVY
jgi:S1-C subfamily serine protease